MDRKQTHRIGPGYFGEDKTPSPFTTLEVLTRESWDERLLASKFVCRTRSDSHNIDISIEEYVGNSRRAKLTSIRLEEDAARALYEQLYARFRNDPPA